MQNAYMPLSTSRGVSGCFYEDLELLGLDRDKMTENGNRGEEREDREGESVVYNLTER